MAEYVLGPTVFTPLWRESRYAVDLLHCKQFCVMQNNVCVCVGVSQYVSTNLQSE